jgi:DNA-binding transcriptional MerR regulator
MEILKEKYTITELSEILQITDHALRFYEKEFGLNIPKDERGRRYYTAEMANAMYKIKVMRNEGLEIKAIKKIFQEDPHFDSIQSETDETAISVSRSSENTKELQQFFQEFGQQLTQNLSTELSSTREQLSIEINKSKLELGACVENSVRKLENKMEKHYQDVDRALGLWREKNRKNPFKKFIHKFK